MKVISIGLDISALDQNSPLVKRLIDQSNFLDNYVIFVPYDVDKNLVLTSKLKIYGIGGPNRLIKFLRIYKKILQVIDEGFDIVTVQDSYFLGLLGWLISKKRGLVFELQVHGFEKVNILRRLIFKFNIKKASAVRVVSSRLKKELMGSFGIDISKIYILPVLSDVSQQGKPLAKIEKDSFIFLTIGRLVPVKNIELQLRAFVEISKKYPQAELWIVGDGPERERLENLSKSLSIYKKVSFWGWEEDVSKFYNQADAFVLTSFSEGWGRVIVEAAYFGLPIVMTDVGLAGEFIKDGYNGKIIKVGDLSELSKVLEEIIENKELTRRLGQNVKESYKTLPTKEEILQLQQKAWEAII